MKKIGLVVPFLAALGLCLVPSSAWAGNITVQVGYADNIRPNPDFPNNFCNGNTQFDGSSGATCSQEFDAGAIRIMNNTGATMTVTDVKVQINSSLTYDIWNTGGSFTIGNGTDEVLSQTGEFNFDTSDNGGPIVQFADGFQPVITITFTDPNVNGGAVQTLSLTDTGQVLNTGGFDEVNGDNGVCLNAPTDTPGACNESLQWRDIGTAGFTNPGGNAPEPASIVLLLTGVVGLVGFARKYAA